MTIRDKIVLVYDVEVFPNVFLCTVKNTETSKILKLEISSRRNNISKIYSLFKRLDNSVSWNDNYTTNIQIGGKYIFCGYNILHYDNPIINYIIANYQELYNLTPFEICTKIHQLSQEIIDSQSEDTKFKSWYKWKYLIFFDSLDLLTMLYSQKLRVGLKEMQVTMCYPNVQEYEGDFNSYLPESEIDKALEYNENDVNSTEELLNRCKEQINLRLAIEDEYNVKVLNKDGVNIGMKIITQKYLEKTGKTWNQIKDLRDPCDIIDLSKVILPIIQYKTPELQSILEELKQQKVSPGRKGYEKHFLLDNVEYTIGVGGIHTVNKPEAFIPEEGWIISDIDVTSLYPSMIIEHKFYPQHLGKEFLEVYAKIKEERVEAKRKGDKVKNETLKLALNGLSGNLQNEHNFCYSPLTVMKIRMNGQLMLLMLVEMLLNEIECQVLQANTDGIFILRKINEEDKFQNICREWERITKLNLEEEQFEVFYQFAINDYLAIKKGYKDTHDPKLLKKKGLFIDTVSLGKGMKPLIIPEAINKYLADNISIEDTVRNCRDINKFLTYQKVNKSYSVEYNGKLITHINRYYVSIQGYNIFKCKVDKETGRRSNYINMLKGTGVIIANDLREFKEFPKNIDYRYYISEAYKIVEAFKHKQLTLW